jgi:hypothetical protein
LSIGVDFLGRGVAFLGKEILDDVDGLPHPTRNKPRKQRNIVVGDVMVGDPTVSAVADVVFGDQIIDVNIVLGAIR